jgi:menaquinol-cytochrome c reductase iron-sulfur subunit
MYKFQNFTRKVMTREGFMGFMTLSIGALGALIISIPVVGFFLSPVINQPQNVWRTVTLEADNGTLGQQVGVETIPIGQTKRVNFEQPSPLPWAGNTAQTFSWLRRTGPQEFIAFSPICTHLGCPVNWVGGGHLFLCPCHGSVYNADGTVAAGPAPQPLARYPVRVARGRVQIKTEPLPLVSN